MIKQPPNIYLSYTTPSPEFYHWSTWSPYFLWDFSIGGYIAERQGKKKREGESSEVGRSKMKARRCNLMCLNLNKYANMQLNYIFILLLFF